MFSAFAGGTNLARAPVAKAGRFQSIEMG